MTWVKLDDTFCEHPKVLAAGSQAAWLFVAGLCYASRHLTDGFIPAAALRRLTDLPGPQRHARRLADAGLWEPVEDGWRIHDYDEHQRTREQVESEREASRERQRRYREQHGKSRRDALVTNAEVTRPETETETETDPSGGSVAANGSRSPDTIKQLVAGYIADYRHLHDGRAPPQAWRATAGRAIKAALADDEQPDTIARCLGTCVTEGKHPKNLAVVLSDFHRDQAKNRR